MREINFIKKKGSRYQNGLGYRFNNLPFKTRLEKSYFYPEIFRYMTDYKTWCILNNLYCGNYKTTINGNYYFDDIEPSCVDSPIAVGNMLRCGNIFGYSHHIYSEVLSKNIGYIISNRNVLKNRLGMDDNECDVIYYHEVGHIASLYYLNDEEQRELVADEYAVKMTNVDTVISALEKTLKSGIPNKHSLDMFNTRIQHMIDCKNTNTFPLYDKYIV